MVKKKDRKKVYIFLALSGVMEDDVGNWFCIYFSIAACLLIVLSDSGWRKSPGVFIFMEFKLCSQVVHILNWFSSSITPLDVSIKFSKTGTVVPTMIAK